MRKMKKKEKRNLRRLIAGILCICMIFQLPVQSVGVYANKGEISEKPNSVVSEKTSITEETIEETKDSAMPENLQDMMPFYKDGKVCIYNYEQLLKIGTQEKVYTGDKDGNLGTGEIVTVDGQEITYGLNQHYCLMNDIPVDQTKPWIFPSAFTGTIVSETARTDTTVYDQDSDTIYLYNRYQLELKNSETSADEVVMTDDATAERVGMGKVVFAKDGSKLTYGDNHNYVIASSFTTDTPELLASTLVEKAENTSDEQLAGRNHIGQVLYTDPSTQKTYILIGNELQLRAIGSNKQVTPMLFVRLVPKGIGDLFKDEKMLPYYPGDADFNLTKFDETGISYTKGDFERTDFQYIAKMNKEEAINRKLMNADFEDHKGLLGTVVGILGGLLDGILGTLLGKTEKEIVGLLNEDTTNPSIGVNKGEFVDLDTISKKYNQYKYSDDADYIIFRNIDLSKTGTYSNDMDDNWTPLMMAGSIVGDLNLEGHKGNSTYAKAKISNINIEQKTPIETNKYTGIGFFGTITNEVNAGNLGVSSGTVKVSDITLENVTVDNQTNKTTDNNTIVNALLKDLGWLVGGLLDGLVGGVLGLLTFGTVKINLQDALTGLLDARSTDPTTFATGAFAGRIVGDVEVSNCEVTGTVSVNSITNYSGGFVGYAEGVTEYDGLSKLLGGIEKLLASLLNVIPGLGAGDLITILLENGLAVGSLIPTGYYNPVISSCTVHGLTGDIGSGTTDFHGGFIGSQVGTRILDSDVEESSYQILAKSYGGGFAGLSRDAEIKGTLSTIGIELIRVLQPQSIIINSHIKNCDYNVNGEDYVGGFIGAQANSYAINDTIASNKPITVTATKSNAGGFTGRATVGWTSELGTGDKANGLLEVVNKLLVDLLSSDPEKASMLLSLVGIHPSAILGCQIQATELVVSAGENYAGGMIGNGDGVYLGKSSPEYLNKLAFWKHSENPQYPTEQRGVITGLKSVSAGKNFSGGIAGFLGTASVGGLLNAAVGLGGYLGFTVDGIDVTGIASGFTVSAGENYAGGGIGEAVGGLVQNSRINNVASVTAENRVGGFVGCAGPGDLAGTGGLELKLLGIKVLELKGLLSLGQGVEVQINDVNVNGTQTGLIVEATGKNAPGGVKEFIAGGYIGKSNSTKIKNSHTINLKLVKANAEDGYAGGFIGTSRTGGLAEVSDNTNVLELIKAGQLLTAVGYLIPSYKNCTVQYMGGAGLSGVEADVAGGFVADMQSGTVDNQERGEGNYYAVYNLDYVKGGRYAGGFGGIVTSGALAGSEGGLSILGGLTSVSINVKDLLDLVQGYVPYVSYAGVKSEEGFVVEATKIKDVDMNSGSAGGFIGYGSGAQISTSDVSYLKYTQVEAPENLEAENALTYWDEKKSTYAVTAPRYAGGYIGKMDIGNAASVGSGLKILGSQISLANVLDVLSVVVSTIEHSDVNGSPGGFSVLATDDTGLVGKAGGFAGEISGGHIQESNANLFAYVVGRESAGGYAGTIQPGSVANVLDKAEILNGLIRVENLLGALRTFVPSIKNSETTCVPCGGAVRADSESKDGVIRGLAGGYVGHNYGGQIWGENTDKWKGQDYTGETRRCAVHRLRSVYGVEYAGGYTGLMQCANVADTGSLHLLMGIIKLDNPLAAVQAVYPTEEKTAVYGPLRNLDRDTWNKWVEFVGKYGAYGDKLQGLGPVTDQETLDQYIQQYAYGYDVCAGRNTIAEKMIQGSSAGGYVGRMEGGTIADAFAMDLKEADAFRSAGGFVGEMLTGTVASTGNITLGKFDVAGSIPILQTFVPVIKNSHTEGYQSGARIKADGVDEKNPVGIAGGYVGKMVGGQIWGSDTEKCSITKLRRVDGTSYVGGYAGKVDPGSLTTIDTATNQGLLNQILGKLLEAPADLAKILNATVSTIQCAGVTAWDPWGVIVNGAHQNSQKAVNTSYAKAVGGFAGSLSGAVIGKKDVSTAGAKANGIRSVIGGEYAGGFFGLADVAAVAEVSGNGPTNTILNLINLGKIDVLDSFRTYVYDSKVEGSTDAGLSVAAHTEVETGQGVTLTYSGNAGGFGGALLDGSVKDSHVTNLSNVNAINHAGGFIGYSGKSGVLSIEKVDALGDAFSQLLGGSLGVLNVFGSNIHRCSVNGFNQGFTVATSGGKDEIAGGFVGYGDLARIVDCHAGNAQEQYKRLKLVKSNGIAGGFAGKTNFAYLGDIQLESTLLNGILTLVLNPLVKALYLAPEDLPSSGLLNINLGIIKVQALCDGKVAHVNLLGLKISVELSKKSSENQQETDVAIITIGDSTVKLPCNEEGIIKGEKNEQNIRLTLIKANRTKIQDSSVSGVKQGYDVYGGHAGNDTDGTSEDGYSGGFIGRNIEGLLLDNNTYYCDVVRGTGGKVGPFTGESKLDSQYDFNTIQSVEGNKNLFRIYRDPNISLTEITSGNKKLNIGFTSDNLWNTYTMEHVMTVEKLGTLKDADMTGATQKVELNAYISPAKAVLMDDVATTENTGSSMTPEPSDTQDPCNEMAQIVINKVWADSNNQDKLRPGQITVTLHRKWTENGQEYSEIVPGYDSFPITGSLTDDIWQKKIPNLPAYKKNDEGAICYYTYYVTETEIPEYTTKITASGDNYTFTITNSHFSILPDTGGMGVGIFLACGCLLFLFLYLTKRKNGKVKSQ